MKKLACMLLSLLFILPLASAYGVTFYNPTMNPQDGTLFEKVDQGKLYDVIIDKDGIDLRKVSFKVNKDSTTAGITVYHLVAVPPILPELESTYETLEFRYGGFATHEVTHLRFEFRVAKDWLSDQSVPRDTVAMHWHDEMLDAWEPLSTKITGEDGSYVYYSASLDQGARYFAVAKSASGEKAEAPAPAPQKVVASEPVKPAPAPAEPEVVVQPEPAPVAAPAPTPQPAAVPQPQPVGEPAPVDIAPEEKGKFRYLFYVGLVVLLIFIIYYFVTRLPVRPSIDKEIDRYITESRRHGKSRDEIKKRLLDVGWHHERVEKALSRHKFEPHHEIKQASVTKPAEKPEAPAQRPVSKKVKKKPMKK